MITLLQFPLHIHQTTRHHSPEVINIPYKIHKGYTETTKFMKYPYNCTPIKVQIKCIWMILKNICSRDRVHLHHFLTTSMSALIIFQTLRCNGQASKSNVLQHVLHFIHPYLSSWIWTSCRKLTRAYKLVPFDCHVDREIKKLLLLTLLPF
jgi:hypothetical protein